LFELIEHSAFKAMVNLGDQDIDALLAEATQKGLVLVDSENHSKLLTDCEEAVAESDRLCDIVDSENRPFESKYKARELLDLVLRQCEAARTIAQLEKQRDWQQSLDEKIAALQLRIGSISWDCEEPHNAQKELEAACCFYYPSLVCDIDERVREKEETAGLREKTPSQPDYDPIALPVLPTLPIALTGEALKTLNLLGILWAGRGQPYRSLLYLLLASECYRILSLTDTFSPSVSQPAGADAVKSAEVESAYTHNLFYLAQVYGHLGDAKQSSRYCHATLQRQLDTNLHDLHSALDWVKNCCGIADFFLALSHFQSCALALSSAEKVLRERVIRALHNELTNADAALTIDTNRKPNYVSGNLNAVEIEAELHRRWAVLDGHILKQASNREKDNQVMRDELRLDSSEISAMRAHHKKEQHEVDDDLLVDRLRQEQAVKSAGDEQQLSFFSGLPVVLPPYCNFYDIMTFDAARIVFLRAATRIEAAKKYFVLDGYVTDHATLLQEVSTSRHGVCNNP
jgi:hypothetical protein